MATDWKNTTNASDIHIGEFTKGCLSDYNIIACTRDILESVAALITGILCLTKIVKLHLVKHELWNQYLIFYAASIEIIILTVNWFYAHNPSVDLVAEFLKLFQFLVICQFYCEVASRISKTEYIYKRICLPFLVITFTYYTVLIIVSIARMKNEQECRQPEWLQLSCSEVALGIIFILVGVYITTHINGLRTDAAYKRNLRLSLWGIILSFEVSSLLSASYDIVMLFYGDVNKCLGFFVDDAALFTVTHVFVKLTKWLLPIWAMMFVFKPESFGGNNNNNKHDDVFDDDKPPLIRNSLIQDFKSEFRPRNRSFNYKHLRGPDNEEERRIYNEPVAENTEDQTKSLKRDHKRNGISNSSAGGIRADDFTNTSEDIQSKNQNRQGGGGRWKNSLSKNKNMTGKHGANVLSINSDDIVEVPVRV